MKVGYLGPKGTFSYEACNKVYSDTYENIAYKTIRETILALEMEEVEEVIVPVENSLQGCVTEAIDTLIENEDIYVVGEYTLKINQNLMANDSYNLEEIKEVYSHPQALAQCRGYINKYLSHAILVEVASTALSAKEAASRRYTACICNIDCLGEYDLKLLGKNIQDNDKNETKFWILSKKKKYDGDANIISMLFSTKDKPGALYKALRIFSEYNLNLTKIESRPAKTKLGEYYFLIDVQIQNDEYEKAFQELNEEVGFYRILGKYRR